MRVAWPPGVVGTPLLGLAGANGNWPRANGYVAAKLEAVEQLAALARVIGCSLPQLAVAFTVAHPAVTSAIIGRGPWNTWMGC